MLLLCCIVLYSSTWPAADNIIICCLVEASLLSYSNSSRLPEGAALFVLRFKRSKIGLGCWAKTFNLGRYFRPTKRYSLLRGQIYRSRKALSFHVNLCIFSCCLLTSILLYLKEIIFQKLRIINNREWKLLRVWVLFFILF